AEIGRVVLNTNAGAVGGALGAMILTQILYKKIDLTFVLNGALAGLVSVTADPINPSLLAATGIGAVGSMMVVIMVPLLDRMRLDDVVGAVPVHLGAGVWGGLVAGVTHPDGDVVSQLLGIVIIGLFVFASSALVWMLLQATIGLRFDVEAEAEGLDESELGMEAYPDFVTYEDSYRA
ncbi:MAG: ammonium transporter, partial [Pseudomonadota bacterium]